MFDGEKLQLIDQTKLPAELCYLVVNDEQDAFQAIRSMKVRGPRRLE